MGYKKLFDCLLIIIFITCVDNYSEANEAKTEWNENQASTEKIIGTYTSETLINDAIGLVKIKVSTSGCENIENIIPMII